MERIIINGFKYATDWVNCGAEVIYEIDGENVGVNKTNFDISLSFKWFFFFTSDTISVATTNYILEKSQLMLIPKFVHQILFYAQCNLNGNTRFNKE